MLVNHGLALFVVVLSDLGLRHVDVEVGEDLVKVKVKVRMSC